MLYLHTIPVVTYAMAMTIVTGANTTVVMIVPASSQCSGLTTSY